MANRKENIDIEKMIELDSKIPNSEFNPRYNQVSC